MRPTLVLTVALAVASCGDADAERRSTTRTPFSGSQMIEAGTGGTIEMTTTSGSMALAGTSLDIPAGALGADTTITFAEGTAIDIPSMKSAGPSVNFGPDGTTFSTPAVMTLPYFGTGPITVAVEEANGDTRVIAGASLSLGSNGDINTVTFDVGGFTQFQAVQPQCQADTDCPNDGQCLEGACYERPDVCQCGSGEVCINGFCAAVCNSNDDCGSGFACFDGICFPID